MIENYFPTTLCMAHSSPFLKVINSHFSICDLELMVIQECIFRGFLEKSYDEGLYIYRLEKAMLSSKALLTMYRECYLNI